MIKCTCCGEVFEPRNSLHKYCSKKCKWTMANRKRYKRSERACPGCGCDISAARGSRMYCSEACRKWVANGNTGLRKPELNCLYCGKKMKPGRADKKYCNRSCKTGASTKRTGVDHHLRYLKERERRIAYAKQYAKEHPEVGQAAKRRRRVLLQTNGLYTFSGSDWERCLNRFNRRCAYCGSDGQLSMDHVIPVTRGGTHGAGNIVPACMSCNASKGNKFYVEWKYLKTASTAA